MVTTPVATPVTTPDVSVDVATVAILPLELLHVWLAVEDVSVDVLPTQSDALPVMLAGKALIVATAVRRQPSADM